jgi:hypothetical protein
MSGIPFFYNYKKGNFIMSNKVLNNIKHRATAVEAKWTRGKRAALAVSALGDDMLRSSTTLVLENIDTDVESNGNALIEEAIGIGSYETPGAISGAGNGTSNAAMYRPLSLALARRVYPSLVAHNLVGVQPMAAPVGLAFAMRNYYIENDGTHPGTGDNTMEVEAAWNNIPEYAHLSGEKAASAAVTIGNVTVPAAYVQGLTVTVGDAAAVTAGEAAYDADSNNEVVVLAADEAAAIAAVAAVTADFTGEALSKGMSSAKAEFLGIYDGNGTGIAPSGSTGRRQEIGIKFDQKTIKAEERTLAGGFSINSMNDVKALHEIDLKSEVIDTLQYETTSGIDRELLGALKTVSVDTGKTAEGHDMNGGDLLTVSVATLEDNRQATAVVVNAILFAANTVAKYTKRGKANFVVVSNKVATVIQSATTYFTANTAKVDAGIILSGSESTLVGTINGQISVYLDQFAKIDYATVGYKGADKVSDSGVIFSPYIMNVKQEAVAQENFQPRVGVTSRYAVTTGLIDAGAYYRSIVFTGLDVVVGADTTGKQGW